MNRLKIVFAVLVLIAFSASAAAAGEAGDIHYGLKAGVNISTAYAEGGRLNMYTGGIGGVFMNYHLSRVFQFQPEVLFSMKGWKEEAAGITLTNKINYIDINLLLKLVIPSEKMVQSSFGIGPYIGIKASDSYEFDVPVPDVVNEAMDTIYENLKSTDLGIVFSGEVDVVLENGGMVILDFRGFVGLQNLVEEITVGDATFQTDLKMIGVQFMAGYAF